MPLLNYTTKVDIYTTLGQIQGQLVKHGAKKILQDYDDGGRITSISFMIDTPFWDARNPPPCKCGRST